MVSKLFQKPAALMTRTAIVQALHMVNECFGVGVVSSAKDGERRS